MGRDVKEIKQNDRTSMQLSEICDFISVDWAMELIADASGVKSYKLNKEVEAPFDIAGMTVDQAVAAYGADAAFKYVYDWANHEIGNQEELADSEDEDYDDDLFCQLNIFVDNLDNGGEFEVDDSEPEYVSSDYRGEQ